ncbi:bifunctional diguanylate cyclase/phosphodiesterase [Vibrio sp. SCSIO 43137]|uniref:bifunctional diguanylate cyclase/phosphodiesterase n=1 Tax=Vibrio sp. SCSIO 43137 TaxID=3021011 RepID=UPI0023078DEF|nr:cache domain-containing protein [Vibrio sp. SCSIO 43137]WCE30885.1 cache domain-containing protein [Vibrio sp. SCSIO 43137]
MEQVNDKKLLKFIRVMPVLVIVIATLTVIALQLRSSHTEAQDSLASLREDYLQQQKVHTQQEVDSVYRQLAYEVMRTESALKQDIRERVYEAHRIATEIYNSNVDKPRAEVTKMITDALRALRFNKGRGYYFIYKMDGVNVLHPILPHMEGTSRWDMQDSRGAYITRDVINIARHKDEGFHRWWFFKPGDNEQDYEKLGFIKYFAPLDMMIGTGEYIEDFEREVQHKLLSWISEIRYGNTGYLFIVNGDGNIIAHQNKNLIGVNALGFVDQTGNEYIKQIISTAKKGGGFVRYFSSFTPESVSNSEKISYVRWFGAWHWVIGTGFYLSESEAYLADKEAQLKQDNSEDLTNILLFSLVLFIVMTMLATFLTTQVSSRFKSFQKKINTDFKKLEQAKNTMQHLAMYDSLTELPNRIHFTRETKHTVEKAAKAGHSLAVVLVDIDDFKKINDFYGHGVGDQLLKLISRKFELILEVEDSVSRFGGDEFIFCLQHIKSREEIRSKVIGIQALFEKPLLVNNVRIKVSCSIGVAGYPFDASGAEELISRADLSLYQAKESKGTVTYFDASIAKKLDYEFMLEEQLKGALERNEISVYYQPQICSEEGKLAGVEALCRWNSAKLGAVSPLDFIEVAERIGMIHPIGQYVLQTACRDMMALFPDDQSKVKLSVNISPKQLKLPHFADDFYTSIKESGINANRVTLEITENVLLDDKESVAPILEELRALGFGISLDDFGTGFSSLSYLNNLPISEIKIDRSFVIKMLNNKQSDSLVKAILAIGQSCEMKVVAEGVETREQFNQLREYRCDMVQGYFFDKPLTVNELRERADDHWIRQAEK